jgi:hypothetical protein
MLTGQDDVCLNKAAIIERALRRMKEEYAAGPQPKKFYSYRCIDSAH